MPHAPGTLRRDPLSVGYDWWARGFLEDLKADPWNWHARYVLSPPGQLDQDHAGLTRAERAAQRSLYWCLGHAASSGLKIRPEWSLQVIWGERRGRLLTRRVLTARVTPREAGRRAVNIRGRESYIGRPTSRGQLDGEDWKPKR